MFKAATTVIKESLIAPKAGCPMNRVGVERTPPQEGKPLCRRVLRTGGAGMVIFT